MHPLEQGGEVVVRHAGVDLDVDVVRVARDHGRAPAAGCREHEARARAGVVRERDLDPPPPVLAALVLGAPRRRDVPAGNGRAQRAELRLDEQDEVASLGIERERAPRG